MSGGPDPADAFGPPERRNAVTVFAVAVAVGLAAEAVISLATGHPDFAALIALGVPPSAAAAFLARRGRAEPAAVLAALSLLLSVAALATYGQGIHDLSVQSYSVILLMVCFLARPAAAVAVGAVAVACLAWLAFGEAAGLIPFQAPERAGAIDFLSVAVLAALATGVGLAVARSLAAARSRLDAELTERRQAEARIGELLAEKELLLREVHHRIKNNMNTVYALLRVEADRPGADAARDALLDSAGRVGAMMRLYDKLYRSALTGNVSLRAYLADLAAGIRSTFPDKAAVAITVGGEDLNLHADAVAALGLIVNELAANSLKYAFPGRAGGRIEVGAVREEGRIVLRYADDGVGLPAGVAAALASGEAVGFGMELVKGLAVQLGGEFSADAGAGARFSIAFPASAGDGAR